VGAPARGAGRGPRVAHHGSGEALGDRLRGRRSTGDGSTGPGCDGDPGNGRDGASRGRRGNGTDERGRRGDGTDERGCRGDGTDGHGGRETYGAGGAGWLAARALGAPAAASAGTAVVTVQNKVALGAEDLVEDSGPAYLSSRAIAFCGSRGCKEVGTDVVSGAMLPATCTVVGERMWNHNLDSPAARNPHRVESELWYRVSWPDGRSGYLSEVYLEPASRGGLGLPACG
jgi:hypothetical protein